MRLIDAEAFEKQIEKEIIRNNTIAHAHFCNTGEKDYIRSTVGGAFVIVKDWVNMQPTIEAKPVVHAHWEGDAFGVWCSRCEKSALWNCYDMDEESKFCPHCGAQMDEGVKIPVISMEDVPKIMEEMENNA